MASTGSEQTHGSQPVAPYSNLIRAVYFDFGGVLTPGGKTKISKEVPARHFGLELDDILVDDLDEMLGRHEIETDDYFELVSTRYGQGKLPLTEARYLAQAGIFEKNKEAYELAEQLRARGITTGILSNVTWLNRTLLSRYGMYDGFTPIVTSCEVGVRKPSREIYFAALGAIGCRAQEVLFVDDQERCLLPAEGLNMQVLHTEKFERIIDGKRENFVDEVKSRVQDQNGIIL